MTNSFYKKPRAERSKTEDKAYFHRIRKEENEEHREAFHSNPQNFGKHKLYKQEFRKPKDLKRQVIRKLQGKERVYKRY